MDNASIFASLLIAFTEIITYLLIIICAIKMVKYVNLHTGFDENMKILVKQLTKTLIILSVVPLAKHAEIIILILIIHTNNNVANIIRLILSHWFHFTPIFNSIVCILTNKPYRNAVFKSIKIFPQ
uniref:Uncharacterized protein n=1 Tax=Meloidogyne enterolobii TaxID=390850 RepID=A0A6V7VHP6_MELEN|nr:unnamed protein product [Meloidogyne enterolobii]